MKHRIVLFSLYIREHKIELGIQSNIELISWFDLFNVYQTHYYCYNALLKYTYTYYNACG